MLRRISCLLLALIFVSTFISIQVSAFEIEVTPKDEAGIFNFQIGEDVFGTAGNFNLFAFGEVTELVHVEGAVAINGKYVGINGLSMGTSIKQCPKDYITFLSNGGIDANNTVMSCEAGHIGYNPSFVLNLPSYLYERTEPLDSSEYFSEMKEYLELNSTALSKFEAFAPQVFSDKVVFDCHGQDCVIFNYDGRKEFYEVKNVGKLAIINIFGTEDIDLSKTSTDNEQRTLYNLVDAPNLLINCADFHGSVLAPNSDVYASNGYFQGNLICHNLISTGSFEFHWKPLVRFYIDVEENKSETDIESDADLISETDTKSETDIKSDTDIKSETDLVSETDIESKTDLISETDIESKTDLISETDIESKTDLISETDIESDADIKSETDLVSETDIKSKTDIESDADLVSETDTEKPNEPNVPEKKEDIPFKEDNISKVLGDSEERQINTSPIIKIESDSKKEPVKNDTSKKEVSDILVLGATDEMKEDSPKTSDENYNRYAIAGIFLSSICMFWCYCRKKKAR